MEDYTVKKHPDGQISVVLNNKIVMLRMRINSYEDLFLLKTIVETHKFVYGVHIDNLYIPCLYGQRGDRRFRNDGSFDLKIITDFINSCGFKSVEIFDTHSDVSLALIENSSKRSSFDIIDNLLSSGYIKDVCLCSPDAGAYKKVFKYAEDLELSVVAANKYRDLDNKIILNFMGDVKGKNILIVDDLCSRGGTFMELGKQLKEQGAEKLYLYISHFEGGCNEYKATIDRLKTLFDEVITTNSYRDFDNDDYEKLHIITVI